MYAVLNYAIVLYAFFAVRETGGRSPEEMDLVFGADDGMRDGAGGAALPDDRVALVSDYD
ncbi:hypothetical protein QBC44DRAFT_375665 [Cladorrhinum sp. PSN332]|nr:hypothetical protein QBC44DRAFT_375665 [Cladorrhinum sp. PSN332]